MTTVRSVVHPGFVEVTAPGLTAVVEVAERHVDALANAAGEGLLPLLDLLCSRGLLVMPSFGIVTESGTGVRAVVRGTVEVRADDGEAVTAQGREPWLDLDLDGADLVTVSAPEPEPVVARGWRRPAVLAGGSAAAAAVAPPVVADEGPASEAAPEPDPSAEEAPPAGPSDAADAGAAGGTDAPEAGASDSTAETSMDPLEVHDPPVATDEPQAHDPVEAAPADAAPIDAVPDDATPADEAPVARPVVPADLTLPPPEDGPSGPPASRVPPSPPPAGGIISSVPWRRGGPVGEPAPESARGSEPEDAAPPPPPAAAPPPPVHETMSEPPVDHTPAQAPGDDADPGPGDPGTAAYPAPEATPRPDPGPVEVTTARGSLPRSDEDLDRPVVLAVLCPAGHHSPPHAGRCRQCGREIPPQQPTPIPRPSLGVLRISTGGVVPLDRGVLLGRAPRVNEELPPNQRPHLIRVGSVDRDISRNHAEVVLEGWHVLVRDLGSTNGTTVALPGEEPVRLRPTEDQGIEPGSVITLADEVSLTYEVEA